MHTTTDAMKFRLWVLLFFCLQLTAFSQPVHTQSLRGHVPAAVSKLKPSGQLEPERELHLAIGLPLRNREALTNLLQRIYNPASPDFHHYLTPAQFAEAFAPTESNYQAVALFARSRGLRVTGTYSNRALLDVAASVSNIEKALHLKLRTFPHPKEKRLFFAPDAEPSLDLATPILHISGLDDYLEPHPANLVRMPEAHPAAALATGSGPGGTLVGIDFRSAYAPGLALDGAGQSLALLEFDGYYPNDISNYVTVAGLPHASLTNVYLDSVNGVPGKNNLEVSLDIEMAISMAPRLSSLIVYEGLLGDDILNRIASDASANQISSSWIFNIDPATEQIFQQFAAQGESYFNASGDTDAWLGNVATPCDDPNITIVGGTTLTTTGPAGAWVSETAWNWDVEYGADFDGQGTGGGISGHYSIPSWQLGVDMSGNQGSTTARNVPDVAAVADNVYVIANFGVPQSVGGTSCAAPLWAAFAALANQQAAAHGRPTLGFLNPALYALGESQNYTNCFHDVTTGNNAWSQSPSRFFAVPGYDLCTGWGTPTGSNLLNLLALDSLQISPSPTWTPGGMVGGPLVPSSQIYTLTNTGSLPFSWTLANISSWLNLSDAGGTLIPGGPAATIVASLNPAAYNLLPGIYSDTIWFTNLTDGAIQSRSVTLSILKPPTILSQPSDVSVIGGMTATFTAIASGGLPLTVQWQFNGTNILPNARISGSRFTLSEPGNIYGLATSTLTISNVSPADAGNYSLVASNVAGSATSAVAALTVNPSGPVIVQQPVSQNVFVGATVHFSVAADGTLPFSYQWQQNGANLLDGAGISGTQTPTLTISGASSVNIGTYSVIVANSIDTVTSAPVTLDVQVIVPDSQLIQNGGFETGSLSPWIEIGNPSSAAVRSTPAAVHSGNFGVLLESPGSLNYLTQTFPTVAGQPYLISLWLDSPDGITPNEFQVQWNDSIVFDQNNIPAIGWTNIQLDVTATNSFTTLQLGFRDDQGFLGLDDVQVVALADAAGPPYIAAQPASLVAIQGGNASFNVLSSGQFPLSYQWQFNGANIVDATNATLMLDNLDPSQAGAYDVLVTNALGSTVSSNAQLTILSGQDELVTFDDLPYRLVPIPPGYDNLNWTNFGYLNGIANHTSGYGAGIVSPAKVAYNSSGAPASISSSSPFALFSAYLTAAWNDNLQVEVQAYNGSTMLYDNKYILSATAPTLIRFNYFGVTSVNFFSSGGSPHPGYVGAGTQFAMDNVNVYLTPNPPPAPPASLALLYSFNGIDGGRPESALTQGADGNLYGTTEYGGLFGNGTIFSMTTNGALTTLYSFGNSDGANPVAALTQGADGNLYGTTLNGGTNDAGTIFSITPGGALTTLASFNSNVTGANPNSALIQSADGNFYGVTPVGGPFNQGTIFSATTNGVITVLDSFNGTNGAGPYSPLVQIGDGNFYGTTTFGGQFNVGTVFVVSNTGALTTLASVTGFNAYLHGLVYGPDGNFYGVSQFGGSSDFGTIFSVTTSGVVSTVTSLNFYTTGGYPASALTLGADGAMYGTTTGGGTFLSDSFNGTLGSGVIFRVTTNGVFTSLVSLENTNGLAPQAGLMLGTDGNLYGATPYGGVGFNGYFQSGDGVVFRVGTAAAPSLPSIITQPQNQIVPVSSNPSFTVNVGGAAPLSYTWQRNGSPIAGATQSSYTADNVLLTNSGDQYSCLVSNAYGAVLTSNAQIIVVGPSGILTAFHGSDGGYPSSTLISDADGNLYGTTEYGGVNGNGSVFKVTTNGVLSQLASFNYYLTGESPLGALLKAADGYYYGTTASGGSTGSGTVFRMTADGDLTVVYSFAGTDGSEPTSTLVQGADGNFYGTTFAGGASQLGTVFKLTPAGKLTTLHSFNNADGANPESALVQGPGGIFYGTTAFGGTSSSGTVFQITPDGALTSLFAFDQTNGAAPEGALIPSGDGGFYGTTTSGGISNFGTLFKITTNGSLTTMFLFDGTNGADPHCDLVQGADGNFYGTTSRGGAHNDGTVFSMTTNGIVTNLYSFQGTDGASPNAGLMQAVDGNFYGTVVFGGIGFDGQISSGNGAVFRIAATVPPQPPVIISQPVSLTALVGNTAAFSVSASSSTPLNYAWQRDGVPIPGATQYIYTTDPLQLSNSGSVFSCLISNGFGSVITTNVSLTVIAGVPGLITFDKLPKLGAPVPNGYFGLKWDGFYCATASNFDAPNGFLPGTVSTNNVAYNFGGANAGISSSTSFNLLSTYLTAAWNDNLQIEVQGYKGSALNYDNSYTLSATSPTLITFNFMDVTSVRFIAFGGTPHPGYEGAGTEFALDNMSVIQVPPPPNPQLPVSRPVTIEYAFGGFDGGHPVAGLALGGDGNLYGTTEYGGANELGTVYRLNSSGQLSTVVSFGGLNNGAGPQSSLLAGSDGSLYGVTAQGGTSGQGTVFNLTPSG
ncbi:MAG TPA: choice-of-anchor tandem repeat GloVer-containing protein, partial [Verrucomicrobiae bacterium]